MESWDAFPMPSASPEYNAFNGACPSYPTNVLSDPYGDPSLESSTGRVAASYNEASYADSYLAQDSGADASTGRARFSVFNPADPEPTLHSLPVGGVDDIASSPSYGWSDPAREGTTTTAPTMVCYSYSNLPDHALDAQHLSHGLSSCGGGAPSRYDFSSREIYSDVYGAQALESHTPEAIQAPRADYMAAEALGHAALLSPPNITSGTSGVGCAPVTQASIMGTERSTANGRKQYLCNVCGTWRSSHNRKQHLATHDLARVRYCCPGPQLGYHCRPGLSWSRRGDMWDHVRDKHPGYPAPPKQNRDKNNKPPRSEAPLY
ncbi:hypothetical protein VTO73DRAFT_10974 [Trametes versicolor]